MNLDFFQVSFLAVLQGLTEFLPISSSGHLVLPSLLFGWTDQGLTFDVAVHVGTLLAVISYFRNDLWVMLNAWLGSIASRRQTQDSRLAWMIIIATVPAGLAGLLLGGYVESYGRSLIVIASTSILFAILLLWSDKAGPKSDELHTISWKTVIFIGLAQALALIPGTSRSGVTMTAALACGLNRVAAARFSFLLAVPIIAVSGLLKGFELFNGEGGNIEWAVLAYAATVSAVVAYSCIHYFLNLIETIGFFPFALYRMILGVVLLVFYFV